MTNQQRVNPSALGLHKTVNAWRYAQRAKDPGLRTGRMALRPVGRNTVGDAINRTLYSALIELPGRGWFDMGLSELIGKPGTYAPPHPLGVPLAVSIPFVVGRAARTATAARF